jgi:hypothetical protein
MHEFHNNCFDYFNVTYPYKVPYRASFTIQTITPFIFIKEQCLNLIKYIENKEKTSFKDFFINSKLYTEFYLYYAYLIYSNNYSSYHHSHDRHPCLTVGKIIPENSFNNWDHKQHVLQKYDIKIFSIHRTAISTLNNQYKQQLMDFYIKTYKQDSNIETIIQNIFDNYTQDH